MNRVAVTGANGFIGQHLCTELLSIGWKVRGIVRRPEAVDDLPDGVEPFLLQEAAADAGWSTVLQQVDSVVHLVGRAHILRERVSEPLTAYRGANVDVTRYAIEACAQAKVRRFVFVSSIAAVGKEASAVYSETTPCRPEDAYGMSKLEAEAVVLRVASDTNIEPVILRPPMVYGPGAKGNFPRLLRFVERGIPFPLGLVHNMRSIVFVRNLTNAITVALKHPAAPGKIFQVADPETLSTKDLIIRLGVLLERPVRMVSVPLSLLRFGGRLLGRADDVSRLIDPLIVSTEKIGRVLDWTPPYTVEEGLAETVNWYLTTLGKRKTP